MLSGALRPRVDLLLLCSLQLLACLTVLTSAQVKCARQISSCQCQTDSGKYIDLAPLAKKDDYRFKRVPSTPGNWEYSYNPCYGFQCEGAQDVAVCQEDTGHKSQFALGTQGTAQFGYILGKGLHIKYTSSHTSTTRISIVQLVCDQTVSDGMFEPLDDGQPSNPNSYTYSSKLTSKYACEVDSLPDRIGGGGMSAGDILLIIFFVSIFVYLLGGFVFNVLVRKTPLGPSALPNVTFWQGVVGYIREGATFCFGKVKRLFTMRSGGGAYESV